MLVYTVYNVTKNNKKASLTRKVCEQLEQFLNSIKFNKFESAIKAYSNNWHINYKQKTDKKGIVRTIPYEGYLFIEAHQIRFEIVQE